MAKAKRKKQHKHYTPRASTPRIKRGVTILQEVWVYIQAKAKEWGLTPNAAYERIAVEHMQMAVEEGVYAEVIEGETEKRQKAKMMQEIERLIKEVAEMEEER